MLDRGELLSVDDCRMDERLCHWTADNISASAGFAVYELFWKSLDPSKERVPSARSFWPYPPFWEFRL